MRVLLSNIWNIRLKKERRWPNFLSKLLICGFQLHFACMVTCKRKLKRNATRLNARLLFSPFFHIPSCSRYAYLRYASLCSLCYISLRCAYCVMPLWIMLICRISLLSFSFGLLSSNFEDWRNVKIIRLVDDWARNQFCVWNQAAPSIGRNSSSFASQQLHCKAEFISLGKLATPLWGNSFKLGEIVQNHRHLKEPSLSLLEIIKF